DLVCYNFCKMARPLKATNPKAPHGVLEEQCSSPALLLALVGQAAMRGLRDALTAENLKPRQFQLLRLLHAEGPLGQRELGARLGTTETARSPGSARSIRSAERETGLIARKRADLFTSTDRVNKTSAYPSNSGVVYHPQSKMSGQTVSPVSTLCFCAALRRAS